MRGGEYLGIRASSTVHVDQVASTAAAPAAAAAAAGAAAIPCAPSNDAFPFLITQRARRLRAGLGKNSAQVFDLLIDFVIPIGVTSAVYLPKFARIDSKSTRSIRVASNKLAGVPSMREGKVVRVAQWLQARGLDWLDVETTFYSDSMNDLPLLERVEHPVATNPDPRLRTVALERGWRILDLFPTK